MTDQNGTAPCPSVADAFPMRLTGVMALVTKTLSAYRLHSVTVVDAIAPTATTSQWKTTSFCCAFSGAATPPGLMTGLVAVTPAAPADVAMKKVDAKIDRIN